jgi:hypothetical protein
MDMRADLLSSLSCSKHPDNRYFGLLVYLRRVDIAPEKRVITRRDTLIVVDAVKPYAEKIHSKVIRQGGRKVSSKLTDMARVVEEAMTITC